MPPDLRTRLSPFSNIALVCVFQNRQARSLKVRVVTTHLHWDPAFSDIKLLQASILIDWLESTNASLPTVIAGDFNSKPGEPVIDYLIRGKVCLSKPASKVDIAEGLLDDTLPSPDSDCLARSPSPCLADLMSVSELESEEARNRMNAFAIQRQGVKLASAYNSRDLPFTNKTPEFDGIIDHILYSSGTLSIRDVLCDVYVESKETREASEEEPLPVFDSAPNQPPEQLLAHVPNEHLQIAQYGLCSYLAHLPSLPTRHFPSDHVSLCAWLKWKTVPVVSSLSKPLVSRKATRESRSLSLSMPSPPDHWISFDEYKSRKQQPRKSSLSKEGEFGFGSLSLDEGAKASFVPKSKRMPKQP